MKQAPSSHINSGDCIQISLRSIVCTRAFVIAAAGYILVLIPLFWPLVLGNVLHAGSQTRLYPPFIDADYFKALPYDNVCLRDFVWQFAPFEEYQYHASREHRFPTWNPHIYLGQPFHADGQSAMLFPTHWVYFLVDPNLMRGATAVVRLWISAVALFGLLRKFSLAPSAAFTGGAVWMLGSFNIHFLLWPHSNASLWTPVALLAIDYLLLRPGWRRYAITSLATAPLFLSGHPGTIFLCVNLIGIFVFIRLLGLHRCGHGLRQILGGFFAVAAAGFTSVLLALPALLPLFLQIRCSFDYLDPAGHRNIMRPIPLSSLWMYLIPEYFGRSRGQYGGFDYTGPDNYIEAAFWFGALACILAMAVLFRPILVRLMRPFPTRQNGNSFVPCFGITTFLLSLLIVFHVWPVYSLISSLPFTDLTNLRRFLLANNFAGAILAAWAVQRIVIDKDRLTAVLAALFSVAACVLIGSTVLARADEFRQTFAHSVAGIPTAAGDQRPQILHSMFEQFAGVRVVTGAVVFLAGSLLLIWIVRRSLRGRESPAICRHALVAIITLDVLLPAYGFNPVTPLPLAIPPTPAVLLKMIHNAGDGRLAMTESLVPPNLSMHYGFADLRGYDLPHDLRLVRLYQRLQIDGIDSRGAIPASMVCPQVTPSMQAYLNRTCVRELLLSVANSPTGRASTELTLNTRPAPGFMPWPRIDAEENGMCVFSNPNSYPRVYLAKRATSTADPTVAMDALLNNARDLRELSVYESDADAPALPAVTDPSPATACITSDEPERVTIDCMSNASHLLVLSDRMDQGWQVQIDGRTAHAVTTDYLFRGVFVPGGHHIVIWTYHAPGLLIGMVVSIFTLAGLLFTLVLSKLFIR